LTANVQDFSVPLLPATGVEQGSGKWAPAGENDEVDREFLENGADGLA